MPRKKRRRRHRSNHKNYRTRKLIKRSLRKIAAREWRPKVLRRDGRKCRLCGRRGSEVHHIRFLCDIIDDVIRREKIRVITSKDRQRAVDVIATSHEFRTITNGICVCHRCHSGIHKRR